MNPAEIERWVGEFLEALGAQKNCYEQMVKLAEAQKKCLLDRATDSLAKVMELKQALADRLTGLEARVAAVRSRWPEIKVGATADHRTRVNALVDEVGPVLRRLLVLEQEASEIATQIKDAAGADLRRLWEARKAQSAYGSSTTTPRDDPRFLDRSQ